MGSRRNYDYMPLSNHMSSHETSDNHFETLVIEENFEISSSLWESSRFCFSFPSIFKMSTPDWLQSLKRKWFDYFPLRVLTVASAVFAVFTLLTSIIHYSKLHTVQDRVDVHNAPCLHPKDLNEVEICQIFQAWNLCSVTGIIISSFQLVAALLVLCVRSVRRRTNLWCAAHAAVFVVLLTASALTIMNKNAITRNTVVENLVSLKSSNWFISIGVLNSLGSLAAIIFVSLYYGMDGQYTREYTQLTYS